MAAGEEAQLESPLSARSKVKRNTAGPKQVFDVQWNFSNRKTQLVCASFRQPAGNGLDGRFTRPEVRSTDRYELVESEVAEGQWALRQLDEHGQLKHQLTTYGKVRAIGADFMLYIGDGEYGTLFTSKEREYGDSDSFAVFFVDPPEETVNNMWDGIISSSPSSPSDIAAKQNALLGTGAAVREASPGPSSGQRSLERRNSKDKNDLTHMLRGVSDDGKLQGVRFYHEVGAKMINNLTELDEQEKAKLWWNETDFEEFVKVRKEIEKAYGAAARQLGVDLEGVRPEGAKGKEAYEAMVAAHPEFMDESRRGLGLGRKKQRARNRDAYIAAVVQEQERQDALEREAQADGVQRPAGVREEAIGSVAVKASEKDREYAHILAQTYYEQDRTYFAGDSQVTKIRLCPQNLPDSPTSEVRRKSSTSSVDSTASSEHLGVIERGISVEEFQELNEDDNYEAAVHARLNCKGFGLSRQKLEEFGLSATGHAISRRRQGSNSAESDDGTTSAGESDQDF